MTPTGLVVLLLAARPSIVSHTDCPSSRDIDSHVSVLMPDTGQPGTAIVSATNDGLLVDLRPDNAAFAAMRTVTVGSDCEERARAAAVVISTWWPVEGAISRTPELTPGVAAATASTKTYASKITLSVGGFVSLVSDGSALGGRLEAEWRPRPARGLGVRASTAFTGPQTSQVSGGEARWSRATAELGPAYSLGRVRLDVGAVASLLWIRGAGFKVNQTSKGASFGITLGGRVEWPWRWLIPWVEVRGFLWPQTQTIAVLDVATEIETKHSLPRAELQVGGGAALAF